MRIIKRFSWHSKSGEFAERFLRTKFFPSLGLQFRKIRKDKKGSIPDGWILRNKQKIALVEIKLIRYSPKSDVEGVHRIAIDKTIQGAIGRAKKQLKDFNTELPKILYLILDDSFADSRMVLDAAFGPWITVTQGEKTIYNGPRGFHPTKKAQQDNKILGNWLSAIFCYMSDTDGYKLLFLKPQNSIQIPKELMPTEAIQEIWEYSATSVIKKK